MRSDPCAGREGHAFADYGISLHGHVITDDDAVCNYRRGMNPAGSRAMLHEPWKQRDQCVVRLLDDDAACCARRFIRKFRRNEQHAGARSGQERRVSLIREKRELIRLGTIKRSDAAYAPLRFTNECAANEGGDFSGRQHRDTRERGDPASQLNVLLRLARVPEEAWVRLG